MIRHKVLSTAKAWVASLSLLFGELGFALQDDALTRAELGTIAVTAAAAWKLVHRVPNKDDFNA